MRDKDSRSVIARRNNAGSGAQSLPAACRPVGLGGKEAGFTLLELIITITIIAILAAGTVPIARNLIKRDKEMELRRNLREIRRAIDAYKKDCESANPPIFGPLDKKLEANCYPATLDALIEGIHPVSKPDTTIRWLRRIPKDPITGNKEWGLRSVEDDPTSTSWDGNSVFDVYSKSTEKALDGKTQYKDW